MKKNNKKSKEWTVEDLFEMCKKAVEEGRGDDKVYIPVDVNYDGCYYLTPVTTFKIRPGYICLDSNERK